MEILDLFPTLGLSWSLQINYWKTVRIGQKRFPVGAFDVVFVGKRRRLWSFSLNLWEQWVSSFSLNHWSPLSSPPSVLPVTDARWFFLQPSLPARNERSSAWLVRCHRSDISVSRTRTEAEGRFRNFPPALVAQRNILNCTGSICWRVTCYTYLAYTFY